jgi:hypothetical protein
MFSSLNRLCLCAGFLLAPTCAGAQDVQHRECFSVVMNNSTGGGSLGAILIDKCTGNSWILARTSLANGVTTSRWFPITVEKEEIGSRPGGPQ